MLDDSNSLATAQNQRLKSVTDHGIKTPAAYAKELFFSVNYMRRGGEIYRLSRLLGHTSVKTTEIYLRSMGVDMVESNQHLSRLSPRR